jgi:hypothetical protein
MNEKTRGMSRPEIQARETAWATESERRIDAFESGRLKARAANKVFRELKEQLGSRKSVSSGN